MGDLLYGQELIRIWFGLRRRPVLEANGLEHLVAKMAKLVADYVPQELTQRCLDAQNGPVSLCLISAQNADVRPRRDIWPGPSPQLVQPCPGDVGLPGVQSRGESKRVLS